MLWGDKQPYELTTTTCLADGAACNALLEEERVGIDSEQVEVATKQLSHAVGGDHSAVPNAPQETMARRTHTAQVRATRVAESTTATGAATSLVV